MVNSSTINTVLKSSSNKLKEKGSQFIGFAFNINDISSATRQLQGIKNEFYDASHHCYGYKLVSGEEKYSDDGEPNGTAGLRIMNAINHFDLSNVLVVVVRYFGGTKLGVGPLGKAYYQTAIALLESTKIIKLTDFEQIEINYNYEDVSKIHYLLTKYKCEKIVEKFETTPIISCLIEPFKLPKIVNELNQITFGNASLISKNKHFYLKTQTKK